jgi:hypothetical protein
MTSYAYSADGKLVAVINKAERRDHDYRPDEPWRLLYVLGRIDRFATQKLAAEEARKTWPGCTIKRT